jgi:hypothetical protein
MVDLLLERHLPIHPNAQLVCCFIVELDRAILDSFLCYQLQQVLLLEALSECQQCHHSICCIKLQSSRTCTFYAYSTPSLNFCKDLLNVSSSRHSAEAIYKHVPVGSHVP